MEVSILVYVLLMIATAKALGEAVSRINQPSIIGELLAGIILGPFILGKIFSELGSMYSATFLGDLADLGILFLMLFVGLEFSLKGILASSWRGALIAGMGIAIPMVLGAFVGAIFGLGGKELVFVAIAVSVTALPVTIRILKDLDVMDTRTSETIISAALITDLVLLFAMGIVISSGREATSISDVLVLAAGFAGFFVLAFLIGKYAVPYIYRLLKWMRTGEAAFAVAVGIAMGFAVIAQVMGLPSFIGAFIAGLILRETGKGLKVWVRVEDILSGVTLGFLAPIFFVLIGFSVKFDAVSNALPMLLAITSVAIVGKIVGSFIPARLLGHGENESMAIGSMMMGKGAMELVFARLAFEEGLIDGQLFSLLVLMAFVSTFLAPILFRRFFNKAAANGEIGPESVREARPDTFPGT